MDTSPAGANFVGCGEQDLSAGSHRACKQEEDQLSEGRHDRIEEEKGQADDR